MSYIEQTREMTQQEKIDWDYSYTQARGLDKWIPNPLDYVVKKCCDNCEYFDEDYCDMDVSNVYGENLIIFSDTFYCSYHKLKFNNE